MRQDCLRLSAAAAHQMVLNIRSLRHRGPRDSRSSNIPLTPSPALGSDLRTLPRERAVTNRISVTTY